MHNFTINQEWHLFRHFEQEGWSLPWKQAQELSKKLFAYFLSQHWIICLIKLNYHPAPILALFHTFFISSFPPTLYRRDFFRI